MAAGIAQKILLQGIDHVESAGVAAYGSKATREAIEVMKCEFDIDISGHRPQDVANLSFSDFDYIIAMGSYEYDYLKEHHQIEPSKLIEWDIEDPYHQGVEAYKKCANKIQKCMRDLLTILISKSRVGHGTAYPGGMVQHPDFFKTIDKLKNDLVRWKHERETGKLRGTLLIGIASKAASRLDKLLRELLKFYLSMCGVDYDQMLRTDMKGKDIDKLTMGQSLECFEKMNKQFTKCCRNVSPEGAQCLKNRRLLTNSVAKQLGQVIDIWNRLHHPEEYENDVATLENDIGQILTLIQGILADALFELVLLIRR
jgi:protein-tyrosine-phosphatase